MIIIEILGGINYDEAKPEYKKRIDATRARLKEMGYKVSHIQFSDYLAIPE